MIKYVVFGYEDFENVDNYNFEILFKSKNLKSCEDFVNKTVPNTIWNTLTIEKYDYKEDVFLNFRKTYRVWNKIPIPTAPWAQ